MIHPATELRPAGELGFGVFSTREIPRGTIVWALDALDQRLDASILSRIPPMLASLLDRYAFTDARGDWVLCWDHGRFVNHSCAANVLSTGWDFDIAVADIALGEELTTDYGCLNLGEPFDCHCGAPICRQTVCDDDFGILADAWDARVAAGFQQVLEVEQPLWPLLANPAMVRRRARRRAPPPSIRNHRYPAEAVQRVVRLPS